ncbi:MAG: hypothetical protein M3Z24_01660, partial [Chloroflexota bacterium]|nr:hypothetical protein [Chloroflexota bacterium]
MIDTLMVLWNRGYSGRGLIASVAFLVMCISISLLLITINGVWILARGPLQTPNRVHQSGTTIPSTSATVPVLTATATSPVPGPTGTSTRARQTPTSSTRVTTTLQNQDGTTTSVCSSITTVNKTLGGTGNPVPKGKGSHPDPPPVQA